MTKASFFSKTSRLISYGMTVLLALGGAVSFQCCGSGGNTGPSVSENRAWLYEHEFAQDQELAARPDQVVILQLFPGDEAVEHGIPYEFKAPAPYLFGIEPDDPFITHATLYDRNGVPVLSLEQGDGGVYMDIPAGSYSLKVFHDGSHVPPEGAVAFIRLKQTGGDPEAAETDPSQTVSADSDALPVSVFPAFIALWAKENENNLLTAVEPCGDGYVLRQVDMSSADVFQKKYHLFSFEPYTGLDSSAPELMTPVRFRGLVPFSQFLSFGTFHIPCNQQNRVYCPASAGDPDYVNMPGFKADGFDLPLVEHWAGESDFWFNGSVWDGACRGDPSYMFFAENRRGYYRSAYPHCNGGTSPIITSFNMLAGVHWYRSESDMDPKTMGSGEVALYESPNYEGILAVLSADTDQVQLLGFDKIQGLRFGRHTVTTAKLAMKDCTVRIVGIDTAHLSIPSSDVAGISTFDAMQFLIGHNKCPYCNLANVDFSEQNLDNVDLSHANLTQATFRGASLKKADMRYALLNGANLNYAYLEGANLCGASLQGTEATAHMSASLQYAYLKNVNLANANLSGAACSYVNFFSDYSGNCGIDKNCGFSANCATAASATLDGANFTNAYLNGVDFAMASIRGVKFNSAMLEGANLTGADLGQDPGTGAATDFTRAFLGGADFTATEVSGVSFNNAFMSLNGHCMLYLLSGYHTRFKGFDTLFQKPPGDPICVTFSYNSATGLPTTGIENICPDGSTGPCSEQNWLNPTIPMNQTDQKASTCYAAEPICTDADYNW